MFWAHRFPKGLPEKHQNPLNDTDFSLVISPGNPGDPWRTPGIPRVPRILPFLYIFSPPFFLYKVCHPWMGHCLPNDLLVWEWCQKKDVKRKKNEPGAIARNYFSWWSQGAPQKTLKSIKLYFLKFVHYFSHRHSTRPQRQAKIQNHGMRNTRGFFWYENHQSGWTPPRLNRAGQYWIWYSHTSATALARRACVIVLWSVGCGLWAVVWSFLWKLVIRVAGSLRRDSPSDAPTPRWLQDAFFFSISSMRFLIDFCSLLARLSTPTCLPKPTEIHQKSMPRDTPSWTSIFDRFLIGFCSQLGPSEPNLALAY